MDLKPGCAVLWPELSTHLALLVDTLTRTLSAGEYTVLLLDTITLWINRVSQLQRKDGLGQTPPYISQTLTPVFKRLCQTWEAGSGPLIKAASNLLAKLLAFTNASSKDQTDSKTLLQWVLVLSGLPRTQKSFFFMTETFLRHIDGSGTFLQKALPELPTICLDIMWSESLANSASKTLAMYYSRLEREQNIDYLVLCTPTIRPFLTNPKTSSNIKTYLLPKVFRNKRRELIQWLDSLAEEDIPASTWLPILKCAIQIIPSYDPIASNHTSWNQLRSYLVSDSRGLRLDAFTFCCGLIATGCPDNKVEHVFLDFECLDLLFAEAQTPEFRNEIYFLSRHALRYLRNYIAKAAKKGVELEKLHQVECLLSQFFDYLVDLLVLDSSYSQLALSTELLLLFIKEDFEGPKKLEGARLERTVCKLLRFTTNNYEDIRTRSSQILLESGWPVHQIIDLWEPLRHSYGLLSSVRGRQSDGAAQLIATVGVVHQKFGDSDGIVSLMRDLSKNMHLAIERSQSIHGYFTAFARMLSQTGLGEFEGHEPEAVSIIRGLLDTISRQWGVFSLESNLQSDDDMWRSVKECSSLLSVLFELKTLSENYLVTETGFVDWCLLLMNSLESVSHRGAFSAIESTFEKACTLSQTRGLQQLREMPETWLKEKLGMLETKKQLVSRRSAGIPYLITGILCSSTHDSELMSKYFDIAFTELLRVGSQDYDHHGFETNDVPQVHAFNCLRSIFRDANLDNGVQNYITSSLALAFENLNHPAWAIKNGAVMLFTALQDRVFGSHKTGDSVPSKSAYNFFNKYPGMSDLLLRKLEAAKKNNPNEVIPILSILSRLQAFTTTDDSLHKFIVIIDDAYLGHRVWQIREMAAQALASMLSLQNYIQATDCFLSSMPSRNRTHGILLCIERMLRVTKQAGQQEVSQYLVSQVASSLERELEYLSTDWVNLRARLSIIDVDKIEEHCRLKLEQRVEELISSEASGNDGALRLFLETASSVLLRHPLSDAEKLSVQFLGARCYEIQLSVAKYWLERPPQLVACSALIIQILKALENPQVNRLVKQPLLELLVTSCFDPVKEITVDNQWNEHMKLMTLALNLNLADYDNPTALEILQQNAADEQEEETRYVATVGAANYLKSHGEVTFRSAEFELLIVQKMNDESSRIRKSASRVLCSASCAVADILSLFGTKYGSAGQRLLAKEVLNSIESNVSCYQKDLQSTSFEIERDNLFSNDVKFIGAIMEVLVQLNYSFLTASVLEMIDRVGQVATGIHIEELTYNVHLDCAIRKAFYFENIGDEAVSLKLADFKARLLHVDYGL